LEHIKKKEFKMIKTGLLNFGWIAAAALLGFAIAAAFAGVFRLPRSIYLIPYVTLAGLFFYAYIRWSGSSVSGLIRHHWVWGLTGAVLVGMFTVRSILSQPASPRAEGPTLVFDLLWSGVVYGLIDALFLSVLPVLATWVHFQPWAGRLPGRARSWLASSPCSPACSSPWLTIWGTRNTAGRVGSLDPSSGTEP
jgi:hypothetical protein